MVHRVKELVVEVVAVVVGRATDLPFERSGSLELVVAVEQGEGNRTREGWERSKERGTGCLATVGTVALVEVVVERRGGAIERQQRGERWTRVAEQGRPIVDRPRLVEVLAAAAVVEVVERRQKRERPRIEVEVHRRGWEGDCRRVELDRGGHEGRKEVMVAVGGERSTVGETA